MEKRWKEREKKDKKEGEKGFEIEWGGRWERRRNRIRRNESAKLATWKGKCY